MANLIITIGGIVLAAILAIVGIYYAGPAFNAAQAKSIANATYSQMQQIVASWQAFAVENGGRSDLTGNTYQNHTGPASLVPKYLSRWPLSDRGITVLDAAYPDGIAGFQIVNRTTSSSTVSVNTVMLQLAPTATAYEVCRQMHKIYNGANAEPVVAPVSATTKIYCVFYDDVTGNSSFDVGERVRFYWQVF